MKQYYVYILFNKARGTLYIGVTSNIVRRVYEHKTKVVKGFTEEYGVDKLGYYEIYKDIEEAIKREKQLKNWKRSWKIELIEKDNNKWEDLYYKIV